MDASFPVLRNPGPLRQWRAARRTTRVLRHSGPPVHLGRARMIAECLGVPALRRSGRLGKTESFHFLSEYSGVPDDSPPSRSTFRASTCPPEYRKTVEASSVSKDRIPGFRAYGDRRVILFGPPADLNPTLALERRPTGRAAATVAK